MLIVWFTIITWHHSGRHDEQVYTCGSGAVTGQRDAARVAAKQRNVLLDPMERRHLVHQPVVGYSRLQVRRDVGVQKACNYNLCYLILNSVKI